MRRSERARRHTREAAAALREALDHHARMVAGLARTLHEIDALDALLRRWQRTDDED